jgi:hypothetical protein
MSPRPRHRERLLIATFGHNDAFRWEPPTASDTAIAMLLGREPFTALGRHFQIGKDSVFNKERTVSAVLGVQVSQ